MGNEKPTTPLLAGSHYAVLGAGVSGRAAARLLISMGKRVNLLDDLDCSSNAEVSALAQQGVTSRWGKTSESEAGSTLDGIDALIPSPGIPAEHPLRREAMRLGLPVAGEIELAWLRSGKSRTVAITGTNGKTTVTMLVRHIFERSGFRAIETGNIGYGFADAVREAGEKLDDSVFSVEVSSFQLEDTTDFAPDVGIILNITPDHLDRHRDMEQYAEAKARITRRQRADQVLVLNQDDKYCLEIAQKTRARVLYFSLLRPAMDGAWLDDDQLVINGPGGGKPQRLTDLDRLPLFGMHNVSNALAASCAAMALGVGRKAIGAALESFKGAPHRLEHVATIDGIEYFNDSKATNIDALVKAAESFSVPIHLIAGGRDKESPFESILPQIQNRIVRAYLIGEAAEKISRAWSKQIPIEMCGTLDRALESASNTAKSGEIILLAPGCASFDQFTSYADRGRKFIKWVKEREARATPPAPAIP